MGYQGKEIFKEPSQLNSITDVMETPPFQTFKTIPKLSYVVNLFDSIPELASILAKMPIIFLESVHGINRAFNSEKHDNLNQIGTSLLNSSKYENRLYEGIFKAYNNSLDIDYLKQTLQENNISSVPINGGNPYDEMQSWQQESISLLDSIMDSIKSLLQSLRNIRKTRKLTDEEKKLRTKANWDLFELKSIWKKLQSFLTGNSRQFTTTRKISNSEITDAEINEVRQIILNHNRIQANSLNLSNLNLESVNNPLPFAPCPLPFNKRQLSTIISTPTDMLGILQEMSNFFLNFFGVSASANLLPALSLTVSNMVLKSLGSSGAMATRYFAGHILRQNITALPVIVQQTGMWGMAWGYLAPFAPWIILTAVIITVGIRKNLELGENLYLFGSTGDNLPDFSYLVLSDSTNKEIYETMANQAQIMKVNSGKQYSELYGFSTYKNKPQFGLNLTDENNVMMMNKGELNKFDNYLNIIDNLWE